jgi:NAD(P)-dependent dehydrogenase (short-subunit alcohol dehydrogenase family)
MEAKSKTTIVIGASRGTATGVARAFPERSYSLRIAQSDFETFKSLIPLQGELAEPITGFKIAKTATNRFGSIDGVVNKPGNLLYQARTEYTSRALKHPSARRQE